MPKKTVAVFGASGETGLSLIQELRKSDFVSKIITISRRPILNSAPDLSDVQEVNVVLDDVVNFDQAISAPIHAAFCCIGTTLGKVDQETFAYVERDLIAAIARKLKLQYNCNEFHLGFMSHPDSAFFIPRIKGQCEKIIQSLEFSNLFIYRPGLLRCPRKESRPLEFVARMISDKIDWCDWWSITTSKLAKVILINSGKTNSTSTIGTNIMEHQDIVKAADIEK